MSGSVVVDASLAVKWLVNEVYSDKAFALARSWERSRTQPNAPYLMPVEVANALHKRVVRHEITLASAKRLLEGLLNSGVVLREYPGIHPDGLELATQLRQNASYDSYYLALADFIDCELWTADERFYRAAVRYYSRVHWVGEI